uniref:Uncharacterized protein n=1 Tax=Tetranychus urticae TaxID=32264 RepID=T1L046_TETUR
MGNIIMVPRVLPIHYAFHNLPTIV